METDGILKIFERSECERGVRYFKFLGDGDSSSYPTVRQAKPYGDEIMLKSWNALGISKRELVPPLQTKTKMQCW